MKKYLLIIFILFASKIVNSQVPNYVPINGLVGWWPFNGNANDESGNGRTGTVNGATLTADRYGVPNSAYYFTGNKNISANADSLPKGNSPRTISLWFNVSNTPTTIPAWVLMNYGKSTTNNACGLGIELNKLNLFFWPGQNDLSVIKQFTLNQYHNLVATYDGSVASLYLDGLLIGTKQHIANTITNKVYIGNNGTQQPMTGMIDDVGIWNRVLTNEEILKLYNGNVCYETVTDTLVINITRTSFNPISYFNTIKVYPNPTKNLITIDNGDIQKMNGYSIKIINSFGQQLYQTPINQQYNTIDITQWGGNGMYYLQVIDTNGNIIEIKKILLQ
jgi:hypothetical protein